MQTKCLARMCNKNHTAPLDLHKHEISCATPPDSQTRSFGSGGALWAKDQ